MIRSGLLLSAGNVSAALLSLLRNILIARLISVEDFGIASTFAMTMAVVETTSYIALDRLVVQARDGDTLALQATAHLIQAVRGVFGAAALFIIAVPLATLFGVPDVAWAYEVLAVLPLVRGLVHLDMFRQQRGMRFLASVKVEVTAQLFSTLAAIPLALAFDDYRAMLFVLLIQQLTYTVISHWVAAHRYRWAWSRAIAGRAFSFGWPLLLNGMLMFAIFHGDRIIVGSLIGMTELGWFNAAFMLTLMPTMVIAQTLGSFFLPQLSAAQSNSAEFQRLNVVTIQAALFMGVVVAVAFALLGPIVFVALYGAKYELAVPVLVWLAVMQAFRLAKAGPAVTALSMAASRHILVANVVRVLLLLVAYITVTFGGGLRSVVALGIAGEGLAFAVLLLLSRIKLNLPLNGIGKPCAVSIVTLALTFAVSLPIMPPTLYLLHVLIFGAVPLLFWTMPGLREWGKSLLKSGPSLEDK